MHLARRSTDLEREKPSSTRPKYSCRRRPRGSRFADLVEVGADAFCTFAITRPHLFRITFHQVSVEINRQPDARQALTASYNALAARFQRAIDAGALPARPVIV